MLSFAVGYIVGLLILSSEDQNHTISTDCSLTPADLRLQGIGGNCWTPYLYEEVETSDEIEPPFDFVESSISGLWITPKAGMRLFFYKSLLYSKGFPTFVL